ncbi:MAG: isoprenylcysteine carboxylmethyltransferase family protein, partial [Gammaproteobacteria bacterium]|nr:isoprenylcysteine carboxylmethyltransferase family protein [Gammaproteobacteria bacterium]
GVYRQIRHPMYLSFWLWAIGQSLLIHNWLAGPPSLIAIALIYPFRVDQEEQQLIEHFGDKYREYQKTTGRILPKL